MPIKKCTIDNKPGFKWGDEGKCYTYDPDNAESRKRARKKAVEQGQAIQVKKGADQKFITQSIIIKKSDKIKTIAQAKSKAKEFGKIKSVRETENSWRFQQISAESVKDCKTLVISKDVSLVRCNPK